MLPLCAIGIYRLINHTLQSVFDEGWRQILIQNNAGTILALLKDTLQAPNMVKISHDPYETLVITIISQNTADNNTERAFSSLKKRFKINPQTLASSPIAEIEACIRVGGLFKSKAHAIQAVSKIILEKFQGNLNPLFSLPTEEARKKLMEMPGVGPKTADVVLLFSANQPTIPVDTHVNRTSKRLGLSPQDGDYEAVRLSLMSKFEPKDYLAVHLLFIALGRKFCKAHNPHCNVCSVKACCPSNYEVNKHG
jgi:endonuclease-3